MHVRLHVLLNIMCHAFIAQDKMADALEAAHDGQSVSKLRNILITLAVIAERHAGTILIAAQMHGLAVQSMLLILLARTKTFAPFFI